METNLPLAMTTPAESSNAGNHKRKPSVEKVNTQRLRNTSSGNVIITARPRGGDFAILGEICHFGEDYHF